MSDRIDKEALIVAGPNGSGKTTFVREFLGENPDCFYLSADAIAARLSPGAPESAAIAAGREFLLEFDRRTQAGDDLIIETTLSGRSSLRMFERLHDLSYKVKIAFIFLRTADMCVERVKNRVEKGGHNVPAVDILRRYQRSLRNFWSRYRDLADRWHIYYNSSSGFQKVASGQKLDIEVVDQAGFDLFIRGMQS